MRRFGFALTSLGDLNKDGFEDIAVGAPYEDGGVVYVYLGSKNGLGDNPSQVSMTFLMNFAFFLRKVYL